MRPRQGLQPVSRRLGDSDAVLEADGGGPRWRSARCCSTPSRWPAWWPSRPPERSTRPSDRPSSNSATTGTSTRSNLVRCPPLLTGPSPHPGWWRIDARRRSRARWPSLIGVHLDLGCHAPRRLAADRACPTDHGRPRLWRALVNLGGDVAVAGSPRPQDGWGVGIGTRFARHKVRLGRPGGGRLRRWQWPPRGPPARTWIRNGRTRASHRRPVDRGGRPIRSGPTCRPWPRRCVEANAWSTAAVVWGEDAAGQPGRPSASPLGWLTPTRADVHVMAVGQSMAHGPSSGPSSTVRQDSNTERNRRGDARL
jgi:hypothetical protein